MHSFYLFGQLPLFCKFSSWVPISLPFAIHSEEFRVGCCFHSYKPQDDHGSGNWVLECVHNPLDSQFPAQTIGSEFCLWGSGTVPACSPRLTNTAGDQRSVVPPQGVWQLRIPSLPCEGRGVNNLHDSVSCLLAASTASQSWKSAVG